MAGTGARGSATAVSLWASLLCLVLAVVSVQSAPATVPEERFLETTELAEYGSVGAGAGAGAGPGGGLAEPSGCYYNFQRYAEGDRIVTNEPCLNCTCHSRMLMCYLRVCPFSKAIGQDCKVEKRADQCCPVITCPEVPVHLWTSTSTTEKVPADTSVAFPDTYGCSIDGRFFPDGVQVPSNPEKPCELCYCIRNRTACVMQECTLQVEGCKPVLQPGVCCPVRYDCDYGEEPSATERPPPSGLILSTPTTPGPAGCSAGGNLYRDGDRIRGRTPCEHCYCMRGDVVCAVQECGPALHGCHALPPKPGRCCPDAFQCANGTVSLEILSHDQNGPEPIPAGSIGDKSQTSSPSPSPSTESSATLKDDDVSEGRYPTTEKAYEATTVSTGAEAPVKGVKGEVGYDDRTTMRTVDIPEQSTGYQPEEAVEATTGQTDPQAQADPLNELTNPDHSEADITEKPDSQPAEDPVTPTDASPAQNETPRPIENESPDAAQITDENLPTTVTSLRGEEPVASTAAPFVAAITTTLSVADDKVDETATVGAPQMTGDANKPTSAPTVDDETNAIPAGPVADGACRLESREYPNMAEVPPSNPCQLSCRCISGVVQCELHNCAPPPPHHKNCVPIHHEGVCCPTYACDGLDAPVPESDSQLGISSEESDNDGVVTTSVPKAEEVPSATTELAGGTAAPELPAGIDSMPLKESATAVPASADEEHPAGTTPPEVLVDQTGNEASPSVDKVESDYSPDENMPVTMIPELSPIDLEHLAPQDPFQDGHHSVESGESSEEAEPQPHKHHDESDDSSSEEDSHEMYPAPEESHYEPKPTVVPTESETSDQEDNDVGVSTAKPLKTLDEEATLRPVEVVTTEREVAAITTSPPLTSASQDSHDEEPNASEGLHESVPDNQISGALDDIANQLNSEPQVSTDRPSVGGDVSNEMATTIGPIESDDLYATGQDQSADNGNVVVQTDRAPVKEEDVTTEQERIFTTDKPIVAVPAEEGAKPVEQDASDISAYNETPENSPIKPLETSNDKVEPTASAPEATTEADNDKIEPTASAPTEKPILVEEGPVVPLVPTSRPDDIATTAADEAPEAPSHEISPTEGAQEPVVTELPAAVSEDTQFETSSEPPPKEPSHDVAVQPEEEGALTTAAPSVMVDSDEVSESQTLLGAPTESAPESRPQTEMPSAAELEKEQQKPAHVESDPSEEAEVQTNKPTISPSTEDQTEKTIEVVSGAEPAAASEEAPELSQDPVVESSNLPVLDSHADDLIHEHDAVEESPNKEDEKEPEQPYYTTTPITASSEEETGLKNENILKDPTNVISTNTPDVLEVTTVPPVPVSEAQLAPGANSDASAPTEPEAISDTGAPADPEASSDIDAPAKPEASSDSGAPAELEVNSDIGTTVEPDVISDIGTTAEPQANSDIGAPAKPEASSGTDTTSRPQASVDSSSPAESEASTDKSVPAEPEVNSDNIAPAEPEASTDSSIPAEPEVITNNLAPAEPEASTDNSVPAESEASTDSSVTAETEVSSNNLAPAEPEASTDSSVTAETEVSSNNIAPAEQVVSSDDIAPAEPEASTDNSLPVESEASTDSSVPAKPEVSSDNIAPVEPDVISNNIAPVESDSNSDTDTVVEPEASSNIPAPAEQEANSNTAAPEEPEASSNTAAPVEPEASSNTAAPVEPEPSSNTAAPVEQEASPNTAAPVEPEASSNTAAPAEPESSTDADVSQEVSTDKAKLPVSLDEVATKSPDTLSEDIKSEVTQSPIAEEEVAVTHDIVSEDSHADETEHTTIDLLEDHITGSQVNADVEHGTADEQENPTSGTFTEPPLKAETFAPQSEIGTTSPPSSSSSNEQYTESVVQTFPVTSKTPDASSDETHVTEPPTQDELPPSEEPSGLPPRPADEIAPESTSEQTARPDVAPIDVPSESQQPQTEPSLEGAPVGASDDHREPEEHDENQELQPIELSDRDKPIGGEESLIQGTTEKPIDIQTSAPESAVAASSQDETADATQPPEESGSPKEPTASPASDIAPTTQPSIFTDVPIGTVGIPFENQQSSLSDSQQTPVEVKPVEAVTESNSQDKFDTNPPVSQSVTSIPSVQHEPEHSDDNVVGESDVGLEPQTTALPNDASQTNKVEVSPEYSTHRAPMESEQATVEAHISPETTQSSQTSALPIKDAEREQSPTTISALDADLPTTSMPNEGKFTTLLHDEVPSSSDQGEATTPRIVSDLPASTNVPQLSQELSQSTSFPNPQTTLKPSDLDVSEETTHADEPEQHTTSPVTQKDHTPTPPQAEPTPYPVTHKEQTATPPQEEATATPDPLPADHFTSTTKSDQKYYPTSSTVTTESPTSSSKAPAYESGYDTEERPHQEHPHTQHFSNVPTVPPSLFLGGQVDEEHPIYEGHLGTTPSNHHFGPPDEPFPGEPYAEDDDPAYGPGTCRYAGKVYVSAQQIPRDDPCDFCFCFRSDIICLQQSCPPPIPGCHEEPISGFCCPRYECPVSMATSLNLTTTSTTTTTTLPPHFLPHAYHGAATRTGCQVRGVAYRVGETVRSASGPCLHCRCGGDGQMQCEPKVCSPEPMLRKMIAAAATRRR